MSLRPTELEAVVAELSTLVGAPVQKAWSPLPRYAYLELRAPGRSWLWCLTAEPEVARLSIADERVPGPSEASSFQRRLRHELIGAKLEKAESLSGGRAAVLELSREGTRVKLALDFAGAELWLLDAGSRPLAASLGIRPERLVEGRWVPPPPARGDPASRLDAVVEDGSNEPFPRAHAAERLHADRERTRLLEEIRRRLLARQRTRRDRLERTWKKVEVEANRTEKSEEHRRLGELLTQNLFRIPRGARSVKLTEYTEDGVREVDVPLDPKRTPRDEAEWHFHQYRRLMRGVEHARRRLAELEQERAKLDREAARIQALPEEKVWEQVALLSAPARRHEQPQARPFKEFTASGGARVWVGKGAESNDELSFKIARPNDVWFHARGVPGSHVVVPLEKNAELLPEVLLDAAHLALHFSQAKGEPRAEVSYTPVKFLKKVKGAPPGLVTYSREKTFMVRVEPERMERLLRSRAEDE